MHVRRSRTVAAAAVCGALLLAACTSPADDAADAPTGTAKAEAVSADATGPCRSDLDGVTTADGNISVSVGGEEWRGYNNSTPETSSVHNAVINDRLLSGFIYFGTDGTICEDHTFGTIEVLSESDPFQVRYTISDDAVWSDGEPVQYADFALDWATQAIPTQETAGSPTPEPLFNHVSGLTFGDYVPDGPQGEVGGKEMTYTFPEVYADWKLLVSGAFPAHVVAAQAGVSLEELVRAIHERDYSVLDAAAQFWNEGWLSPTPGVLPDPALVPVSGPYTFEPNGWTAGQSLTLTANDAYWGPPPAAKELTFRFASPDTHVQALQNGDLDVIEPQATVDTLGQLNGLGDAVTVSTGDTLTWEHLDFNFQGGSAFADDLALREAFALCVPRQQIVDNLIAPVNPDAVVMNAREVFPFQPAYDAVVDAAYDGRYDQVDLDAARAKVAESGATGPVKVRIGYSTPNQRRSDEVALIKSSCDQAGFDVTDVSSPDFFDTTLPNGDYEVALFAWAGSGQIVSGKNIYASDGKQNYGGYSNPAVDAAWKTLASTADADVHTEQTKVIEKLLWDDLYGLPLYAHPGVVAYRADLMNVRQSAAQSGVAWNADQWARQG